jgi:hypothetical protein
MTQYSIAQSNKRTTGGQSIVNSASGECYLSLDDSVMRGQPTPRFMRSTLQIITCPAVAEDQPFLRKQYTSDKHEAEMSQLWLTVVSWDVTLVDIQLDIYHFLIIGFNTTVGNSNALFHFLNGVSKGSLREKLSELPATAVANIDFGQALYMLTMKLLGPRSIRCGSTFCSQTSNTVLPEKGRL